MADPAPALCGRFIVLEGGEGVGKSTQAPMLADALRARGQDVVQTREPGGSVGAELLRDLLLRPDLQWPPLAETMLHIAARIEHVAAIIRPALQAGRWVVCDRFTDSTRAYQGAGQHVDRQVIDQLAGFVDLQPDLVLVLDLADEERTVRLDARRRDRDRYERLSPGFHAQVNAAFRAIAAADPHHHVLLQAAGDPAAVHGRIMEAVQRRLLVA